MATHAPITRMPFAPLDNPRLQHLASAKNRQNGLVAKKDDGKPVIKSVLSPGKRAFEASTFDDVDSENADPALFDSPSKKTKGEKNFAFSLTSMPPPPTIPARLSTPARASMPSPRTPSTAPAGRSPKRKIIRPTRRVSAPFTRVDPPFALRSGSTMPFSLDAALSGTFSHKTASKEGMPKTWFFDIYQDSAEEEAANLMEHSTLTLDLSSDEESDKKECYDRGKENMPPEGYDAPTASGSLVETAAPKTVKKTDIIRKKKTVEDMDDGERSPLSDLETEPFIPEGLDQHSHVVVDSTEGPPGVETASRVAVSEEKTKLDVKDVFGNHPKAETSSPTSRRDPHNDETTEIVVWEDKYAKNQA